MTEIGEFGDSDTYAIMRGFSSPFGGDAGLPIMRFSFLNKWSSNRLDPRLRRKASGDARPFMTRGPSWGQVHYRVANVGIESPTQHAESVRCRHCCRHPNGRQKGQRTNETCRQEWRHGTQESVRHIARTIRKFSLKQLIGIFTCGLLTSLFLRPADGSDLSALAALNAVSGYEQQALDYVRTRVGGQQEIDNTGSLTVRFGTGQPHTLLVAGLDEPGYLVSRIDQEGYLRVHRLADPAPHYGFDEFFVGQPVLVRTRAGKTVPGVVATRSAHFGSQRPYSSTIDPRELFIDIGASSKQEVGTAGIDLLNPVTLEKRFFALGKSGSVTAPWVSARAGGAILLQLAAAMRASPPESAVTLAFVSQQFFYNRGLVRVLKRVSADRVVVIRPGGDTDSLVSPVAGWTSQLADSLVERARALGLTLRLDRSQPLSFGPFGSENVWPNPERSVLLTLGVENAGTPVELLQTDTLAALTGLLADLCGVSPPPAAEALRKSFSPAGVVAEPSAEDKPLSSPFAVLLKELTETPGVSGSEQMVRSRVQAHLPTWVRARSVVDKKGNLIVRLGSPGPPRAIFAAHMDEIGFRVSRIGSQGRLNVETVGGGSPNLFAWHPVLVHGNMGSVLGILERGGRVRTGAASMKDATGQGIEVGTSVTVVKKFRSLLGKRATARSLDDRIGCSVLLSVLTSVNLEALPALRTGHPVWFAFTVEEEVGLLGADFLAGNTAPARVYPVDSFVTSDSPLETHRIAHAKLGEGFVIRAVDTSGIAPPEAVERVAQLARRRGILFQRGITAGGNDGSVFLPHGAVSVPLTWPLRYAHSAVEVADLADAEALQNVVRLLLESELLGE